MCVCVQECSFSVGERILLTCFCSDLLHKISAEQHNYQPCTMSCSFTCGVQQYHWVSEWLLKTSRTQDSTMKIVAMWLNWGCSGHCVLYGLVNTAVPLAVTWSGLETSSWQEKVTSDLCVCVCSLFDTSLRCVLKFSVWNNWLMITNEWVPLIAMYDQNSDKEWVETRRADSQENGWIHNLLQ